MKTDSDKDRQFNPEAQFNPDGILNNEGFFSTIVDYLNDMLASHQNTEMHFDEIRFVRKTVEEEVSPFSDTVIEKTIHVDSERTKLEVALLKDENSELRLRIARLIAQLNETECSYDTVVTENNLLKAKTEVLQNELEDLRDALAGSRKLQEELRQLVEAAASKAPLPEQEPLAADPAASGLEIPDSAEEPETAQEPQAESSAQGLAAEQPLAVEPDRADESSAFSWEFQVGKAAPPKSEPQPAVFSQRKFAAGPPPRSNPLTSKVIKADDMLKTAAVIDPDRIMKAMLQKPVKQERSDFAAAEAPVPPRPQPALVVENGPLFEEPAEEVCEQQRDLLESDSLDEATLGKVPAPKSDPRRQVKNYQSIQEDAEAEDRIPGHTIVL